jgi:hypothetical protein
MLIDTSLAANGELTLGATYPDGRRVHLHSGRAPSDEARAWANRQVIDADAFIVFGHGLGYGLAALRPRLAGRPVCVIEPDPAVLHLARTASHVDPATMPGVDIAHEWADVVAWNERTGVPWGRTTLLCSGGYGHVFAAAFGRVDTLWRALHAMPGAPRQCPALFRHAPGVSVIVPCFNRARDTAALVEGLQRQRGVRGRLEVLVVSDNGPSDVLDAVAALPPTDGVTVRLFDTHYAGYGLVLARNVGIRFARYDTVVCLDDDLVVGDDLVATYQAAGPGLRLGRIDQLVTIDGNDRIVADPRGSLLDGATRPVDDLVKYRGFMYGGNFALDTAIALAVGGFDEAFLDEGEEDMDFGARVMATTRAATTVPAARALHKGPTLVSAHQLGLPAAPARPANAHARLHQPGRGWIVNGGLSYWLADRWTRCIADRLDRR